MDPADSEVPQLSRVYSASSLLLLKALPFPEPPSGLLSPKARMKSEAERLFAQDFHTFTQRHQASLPTLPRSPIHVNSKLNSLKAAVGRKRETFDRLAGQLKRMEKETNQMDGEKDRKDGEREVDGEIGRWTGKTEKVERENETFEEVIYRLGVDLVAHKQKANEMLQALKHLDKELTSLRHSEVTSSVELRDITDKLSQSQKAFQRVRESRIVMLSNRYFPRSLEEAEERCEVTAVKKEQQIEKDVENLGQKQKIDLLKAKNQRILTAQIQSKTAKAANDAVKSEYLAIKLNFEQFFGTSDPDDVIATYMRTTYRSEMLRKEIEEMLSDQDKARKELDELRKMKNDVKRETEMANFRDFERSEKREKTNSDTPESTTNRAILLHSALISLASLYAKTVEKDPNMELSSDIGGKNSFSQLLLAIQKRLETAIIIATQSRCISHIIKPRNPRKRLTLRPEKREEIKLKSTVFRDHFLSGTEGNRQVSATIDSMLNSVASLLSRQRSPRLSIISQNNAAFEPKKRKIWKSDGYVDEFLEKQESSFWASTRKFAKGDSSTQCLTTASDSLPLSSPRSGLRSKGKKAPQHSEYKNVLKELREAQRKMEILRRENTGRDWETPGAVSPLSTQGSFKSKDTSRGLPVRVFLPSFPLV